MSPALVSPVGIDRHRGVALQEGRQPSGHIRADGVLVLVHEGLDIRRQLALRIDDLVGVAHAVDIVPIATLGQQLRDLLLQDGRMADDRHVPVLLAARIDKRATKPVALDHSVMTSAPAAFAFSSSSVTSGLLGSTVAVLTEVLSEVRKRMPFALLGFDTDNDSVFMNATVKTYCEEAGLVFTRCRPYRKNDQAWVEQKNGVVVRRTVGYRRYEGLEAAAALARLYSSLRLFVNFFQPSFKLAGKIRDGAKVKKKYHPPATPYQRLLADARTNEEVRRRVTAIHATLDPVQLLQTIRACQQELVEIADRPTSGEAMPPTAPTTEQFLAGLRTAWQEGEVRPTSKPKEKARRGRRRPDPFVTVTALMRGWFEAEPWRTSRELFERLQAEQPGVYPDGQLRTLQRRLKDWRREMAHKMVFGAEAAGATPGQAPLSSNVWPGLYALVS